MTIIISKIQVMRSGQCFMFWFVSFLKAHIFCWTLLGLFVFVSLKATCFIIQGKGKKYLRFQLDNIVFEK